MSEDSTKDVKDVEKKGQVQNNQQFQNAHSLEFGAPRPGRRRMANPAPMGLFSFAATTFLLSLFTLHTRSVQAPNVVVGMALFGGGLAQFICGMWEIPNGNTFGATAFSSYGAFWMSYATIFIPGSGVLAAYGDNMDEFNQAFGLYLMVWFVITVLFIFPVIRKNIAFAVLLSCLALDLLLLSIGTWNQMASVIKGGAVWGVITGLVAWYIGVSMMMAAESRPLFRLPLGVLAED